MSRRADYRRQAMDVYECLNTRLTIRNFKPDRVPIGVTRKILEAGRWAPSSRNRQPWHFVVITDSEALKQIGALAPSGPFIADAPMAIAIFMRDAERPDLDAGRAIQQMEIMAWSLGLGTCFVGFRDSGSALKVKQLLGMPGAFDLVTVLPFGYRLDSVKGRNRKRKPMSAIAHMGQFGYPFLGR
jgi:nitroreductase